MTDLKQIIENGMRERGIKKIAELSRRANVPYHQIKDLLSGKNKTINADSYRAIQRVLSEGYSGMSEEPAPFMHKQPDNFEKAWSVAYTYAMMTGISEKVSAVDMTRFISLLEREISEHGDIPAKETLVALAKQAGCV